MKLSNWTAAIILTTSWALGLGTEQVHAQFPYSGPGTGSALPENRSGYSPYLNMLRSGSSPTLNYFGLVRPELNFMNSVNGLQQQVSSDQQSIAGLQTGNLPTTGHPAAFLNLGGYFQSRGGVGNANTGGQSRTVQGPNNTGAFGQSNFNSSSGMFGPQNRGPIR